MWHGSNYYLSTLFQIAYNYGGQFQSFSGVYLKLNNWTSLITCLIIVATIVCSQMISELAYLIDCTTSGLISKITNYLGQKPKYIIQWETLFNLLVCKGLYVLLQDVPPIEKTSKVTFDFYYLEPKVFTKGRYIKRTYFV